MQLRKKWGVLLESFSWEVSFPTLKDCNIAAIGFPNSLFYPAPLCMLHSAPLSGEVPGRHPNEATTWKKSWDRKTTQENWWKLQVSSMGCWESIVRRTNCPSTGKGSSPSSLWLVGGTSEIFPKSDSMLMHGDKMLICLSKGSKQLCMNKSKH